MEHQVKDVLVHSSTDYSKPKEKSVSNGKYRHLRKFSEINTLTGCSDSRNITYRNVIT